MKASKQFLQKNGIAESHPDFVALKDMLANNTGYMLMFTKFRFEQQIANRLLSALFAQLIEHRQLLSDLPRPAANYPTYSDLMFDLGTIRQKSAIKQFIQVCPSNLKTIMRDGERYWNEIQADVAVFNTLDPGKRKAFTKTISRHKNFRGVKDALHSFIQYLNAGWDMFSVIDKANKTQNCHIRLVDLEKNIVILRVTSKASIVKMGTGSSWCIADAHHDNYRTYVPNDHTIQYIIFDYNHDRNHSHHRVAMTNRNNDIVHIHDNRNSGLRFNVYLNDNQHLYSTMFKGYSESTEAEAENIIDSVGNGTATGAQISRLAQLGHIDKVIDTSLNASKAIKIYGPIIISPDTSAEQTRLIIKKVLPMVESTKFFNTCIPALHKLDVDTTSALVKSGLFLKYGVHLDEIINTYCRDSKAVTEESVITIDDVQYRKVVTLTPINHLDINVLDAIIATNPEVVTNKALKMIEDYDNMPVFRILLKHYKAKKNNKVRKAYEFKAEYLREIENEGLL